MPRSATIAESAVAEGFSTLLSVSGSALTFRNGDLTALVSDVDEPADPRQPRFTPSNLADVEFLRADVTTAPAVGEHFEDDLGRFLRVNRVTVTTFTWHCRCQVSDSL